MESRVASNGHRPEPVDRDPQSRPGVPMIKRGGREQASAPAIIEPQRSDVPVLVGPDVGHLTPVFSTALPPRGLSGMLRRAAYRKPEHDPQRWMLLLLGDRVDVWENRIRRNPLATGLAVLGLAALFAVPMPRRRRSRWRQLFD